MAIASVPVQLDKPRTLTFDFEALDALESALNGAPLLDVVQRLRSVSLPTLVVALWAGLRADDKHLTINLTKKIVRGCLERGMTYAELSEPVAMAIDGCGLFRSSEDEPVGNVQTTASAGN